MNLQKIATHFAVYPLTLVVAVYFGYRIIDTVLWRYVHGNMTMRTAEGFIKNVAFTSCRMIEDPSGKPQMKVADDRGQSLVFELDNQDRTSLAQIEVDGMKERLVGGCEFTASDLVLTNMSLRRNLASIRSWKGVVSGQCSWDEASLEFNIDVHACR